jgi:hypothetical protein
MFNERNQLPVLARHELAKHYAAQVKQRNAHHDCPTCNAKELEETVIRILERWKQ